MGIPGFRPLFLCLVHLPCLAQADYCGIPEDFLEAVGTVTYALSERAEDLGGSLTDAGSIIMRWSTSQRCMDEQDSPSVFDNTNDLGECFSIRTFEMTGARVLSEADQTEVKFPDSVVVVGWAVSNEPNESGLPKMFARLRVQAYPTLTFNQTAEVAISCSKPQDDRSAE